MDFRGPKAFQTQSCKILIPDILQASTLEYNGEILIPAKDLAEGDFIKSVSTTIE